MKILKNSYGVWLALDGEKCVGFINAISDSVFYSFIPLLEVLPDYRHLGIGTELVSRMLHSLDKMYAIDLICDERLTSFYEEKGFLKGTGMMKRNFQNQNPEPTSTR